MLKSQHERFKIEAHNVFTEKLGKKALSSNDDKRLQTFGGIASYPCSTCTRKVCKTDLLQYIKVII